MHIIYDTVGYRWDHISTTVNEGMNQSVFMKDGKVVCYLYGNPVHLKIEFDFGLYEEPYIRFTPNQKLSFQSYITDDGMILYISAR